MFRGEHGDHAPERGLPVGMRLRLDDVVGSEVDDHGRRMSAEDRRECREHLVDALAPYAVDVGVVHAPERRVDVRPRDDRDRIAHDRHRVSGAERACDRLPAEDGNGRRRSARRDRDDGKERHEHGQGARTRRAGSVELRRVESSGTATCGAVTRRDASGRGSSPPYRPRGPGVVRRPSPGADRDAAGPRRRRAVRLPVQDLRPRQPPPECRESSYGKPSWIAVGHNVVRTRTVVRRSRTRAHARDRSVAARGGVGVSAAEAVQRWNDADGAGS